MSFLHDPKFWVAVSTTIFFVAAFKPAKNAISRMIDEKINKVKTDIEEAAKLKSEALALFAIAEQKLASIEVESENILNNAKLNSANIVKNAEEKLARDIETRKNMAFQKIKNLEDAALDDIKNKVSSITLLAVQTIVEENLDEKTLERLENSSIEKLPKNFH